MRRPARLLRGRRQHLTPGAMAPYGRRQTDCDRFAPTAPPQSAMATPAPHSWRPFGATPPGATSGATSRRQGATPVATWARHSTGAMAPYGRRQTDCDRFAPMAPPQSAMATPAPHGWRHPSRRHGVGATSRRYVWRHSTVTVGATSRRHGDTGATRLAPLRRRRQRRRHLQQGAIGANSRRHGATSGAMVSAPPPGATSGATRPAPSRWRPAPGALVP